MPMGVAETGMAGKGATIRFMIMQGIGILAVIVNYK
jgi:hypothetical protein